MARSLALVVALVVLAPAGVRAGGHGGWDWLIERLVADGVDRHRVERAFDDPRVPPFDRLDFGLSAREPHSMYRGFLVASSIAAARRCRERHAREFEAAADAQGVPASVVAAIIYVESGCGRNTGSSLILYRLARLAMANEPANLRRNMGRHAPDGDPVIEAKVQARARYLDDTFYPEVRGVFWVAERLGVDPLGLRGSGSGAFGNPQFLPTSYLEHGADGDGDGRIDLYDPADAALSCAAYLKAKGWHEGLSNTDRRRVIWAYNRSDAYIDTVLALSRAIDAPAVVTAAAPRATRTAKKSRPAVRRAKATAKKKTPAAKKKPAPKRKSSPTQAAGDSAGKTAGGS